MAYAHFNEMQFFEKLPVSNTDTSSDEVQNRVIDSFVKMLKSMRGVSDDSQPSRKRKTKVSAISGKGITAADMESNSKDEPGTEVVFDHELECSSENETEIDADSDDYLLLVTLSHVAKQNMVVPVMLT